MQQSFFESCGGAGNWPCHADRIELRGNFMTASWDDWITAPLSITPFALCAVSSLFSRSLSHPSAMTSLSFLASSPLLARGSFINVTSLYRRVHRIQLSGWILFFLLLLLLLLLNRGSFSRRCCGDDCSSHGRRHGHWIQSICLISYNNK